MIPANGAPHDLEERRASQFAVCAAPGATAPPTGTCSTRWRWIAAIWSVAGLFDASQTVLIMHAEGGHHPWAPLFGTELASWLPWALATPLIVNLARQHPINRGMSGRTVGLHLAAFAAVSAVAGAWSAELHVLFNPWGHRQWPTFVDTWSTMLLYQVFTFLIAYALILTVTYVVDARERIARQIAETSRLNEELSRAQLAALRRQMEPHFMYNTLNSIAGLVRDRVRTAPRRRRRGSSGDAAFQGSVNDDARDTTGTHTGPRGRRRIIGETQSDRAAAR
jgi:hypothetical protein